MRSAVAGLRSRRVVLGFLGFAAGVFALEAVLRLLVPRLLNPFEPDPVLGFRLKRGFDGFYPWVRVRTDAFGRRVSASEPSTGRILFVGDSVTFGFGVGGDAAYPHLFGVRLGRPADVANAAVPGYNLGQVILALREHLARVPADLVVYGLCLNDLYDAARPARYEDIDPHRADPLHRGKFPSSLLVSVVERRLRRWLGPPNTTPDARISPEEFFRDLSTRFAPALEVFAEQWRALEEERRRTGIPFVVVVLPFRVQVEEHPEWRAPQRYLAERCASSPLVCLDPLDEFVSHRADGLFQPGSPMHLSRAGHRLLAAWLAERIGSPLPGEPLPAAQARSPVGSPAGVR